MLGNVYSLVASAISGILLVKVDHLSQYAIWAMSAVGILFCVNRQPKGSPQSLFLFHLHTHDSTIVNSLHLLHYYYHWPLSEET